MNIILFGATGMLGQGVLRECLLESSVQRVLTVGRTATGVLDDKLSEATLPDLTDYSSLESVLGDYDACFFCLGVSSAGMTEEAYSHLTYDITIKAAETLARLKPEMTFIYVSGAGTDSTEHGRTMWARVKGRTENALLHLPLKTYLFRPGIIEPMHGARSKTTSYRYFYYVMAPLFPLLRAIAPKHVLSTVSIGQAMLNIARRGAPSSVLESKDIYAASQG